MNDTARLLLQAALLTPHTAEIAWRQYCDLVDLQKAPTESTALFPLVYHKLKETDAELNVCKSVYKHTWTHNQAKLFQLKEDLKNIPGACLLRSVALVHYYPDLGLRPIRFIDLLIAPNLLEEVQKEFPHFRLRTELFPESKMDPHFASYSPKIVDGRLSPEDQLIATLFDGLKSQLIQWIPDAAMILQTPGFDWNYFFSQVEILKLQLPIYSMIRYLDSHSFALFPHHVITLIDGYVGTAHEESYLRFLTQKTKRPLQVYWHAHVRSSSLQNKLALLLTLPGFIKRAKSVF